MSSDEFRRIDALIHVGLRLARSAPSGRILLARVADAIDLDWIPRPWGDEIAAELGAADAAAHERLEMRQVERVLRDAWGAPATSELDDLDPEPVAITPTSQVHRGVLDGAPVAVKVLRPRLAASVRQDLVVLEGVLAPLHAAFPSLDPGAVIRELRERILDELDLENEASSQRRFHRALRGHPLLMVPAPITRLARESVLVSEWVDGVPLWQAPDPDEAAARLVLFVLGGGVHGLVHADPDPDDVVVLPDGRLAILDFGATRVVDRERVSFAAAALDAFTAGDATAFGRAAERLGWMPEHHGAGTLELIRHVLGELAGSDLARLDRGAVLAARDRLFDYPDGLAELIVAGTLPAEDLWPARSFAQLFATIARVGATGAWPELALAAVRDGWNGRRS
jgi:predicted unusual protein kinase regulating ubiquinone biosynthesis (AarF/ABC1/UbiB family)